MASRTETATAGPAESRGSRTRGAIIARARERFARQGFDQTKLADVAAAAGVSEPTVAFHFRSKTGLLMAVMNSYYDELVAEIEEVVDAPSSPRERLAAFARFWLATHERSYELHAVFASQAEWSGTGGEGAEAFRANNRRITRIFERIVDDLKAEGSVAPGVPTRMIRDAFFGTSEHAFRGRLHARKPPPLDRVADEILEFVLRGAGEPEAGPGRRNATTDPAGDAGTLGAIDRKLDLLLGRAGQG